MNLHFQLPQSAQWASSSRNSPSNSAPSLAEIQELEAQRAVKEAEEVGCLVPVSFEAETYLIH